MRLSKSKKWYVFPMDTPTRQYLEGLRDGLREPAKPLNLPCGESKKELRVWSPPNDNGYHFAAKVWADGKKRPLNFQIFQSIGGEGPMPWEFPEKDTQEETYRVATPGVLVHLIR